MLQMLNVRPDVFFESSLFPMVVRIAVVSLTVVHSDIIFASLDLMRSILTHDSLDPSVVNSSTRNPPPKYLAYAASIRQVVNTEGPQFTSNLLAGLVNDFPEESISTVITIFRMLAVLWPQQLASWLPQVLDQLPVAASYGPAKTKLLDDVTAYVFETVLLCDVLSMVL